MDSLFSDQFRRDLAQAVARRQNKVPHTVPELKESLRDAIRFVEANYRTGRLMRNQADFPGGRFLVVGYWCFVYRVRAGVVEFMALQHIAL